MTRIAALLTAALVLTGPAFGQQAPVDAPVVVTRNPMPFVIGQVWTLKDAPASARFTVMRIEILPTEPPTRAVHGSLSGFPAIAAGAEQLDVNAAHIPLSDKALLKSVDKLESTGAPVTAAFNKGYLQWRRAEGGVFYVTVAEAVGYIADMMRVRPPAKSPDKV
jgi:hypothetical protein